MTRIANTARRRDDPLPVRGSPVRGREPRRVDPANQPAAGVLTPDHRQAQGAPSRRRREGDDPSDTTRAAAGCAVRSAGRGSVGADMFESSGRPGVVWSVLAAVERPRTWRTRATAEDDASAVDVGAPTYPEASRRSRFTAPDTTGSARFDDTRDLGEAPSRGLGAQANASRV